MYSVSLRMDQEETERVREREREGVGGIAAKGNVWVSTKQKSEI